MIEEFGSALSRVRNPKITLRKVDPAQTGISVFLLHAYVTAKETVPLITQKYVENRLAANPFARKQYERMCEVYVEQQGGQNADS